MAGSDSRLEEIWRPADWDSGLIGKQLLQLLAGPSAMRPTQALDIVQSPKGLDKRPGAAS